MTYDERGAPDREIDKIQAIRHLLHASIRMLFWEEDPFALHLVCQSCDKLILDCMEADGIQPKADFADYIKPEYLGEFYRIYREMYNYLKHAKNDRHGKLGVRKIVKNNEMSIFLNVARSRELGKVWTAHVRYFLGYANIVMPRLLKDESVNRTHLENEPALNLMTRSEALAIMREQALRDAQFVAERNEDLSDIQALARTKIKDYKMPLNRNR
jgi:hypothetical protein